MRTRAGWIALVLTGGLALAPAGVCGQGLDIPAPREAPIVPLPIYSNRPEKGGFYAALEFLFYRQTRRLGEQIVARRGLVDADGTVRADLDGIFIIPAPGADPLFVPGPRGVPGTFIGSGATALMTSDLNSQQTYQPGWATTIGWRFSDGSTFEARWRHIDSARYTAGADIVPPGFAVGIDLEDSFLTAPVYNFPSDYAGPPQDTSLGFPGSTYGIWNAAETMTIEFMQRYDQADFWGKVPIRQDGISRTYMVAGGRFAWVWERFKWRTIDQDFAGVARLEDHAIYTNIVSNRMYGPTLGLQHDVYLGTFGRVGAFSLAFHGDFSAMLNIVKERARYEVGTEQTSAKKSVNEYTFAPMFSNELQITWYPVGGVQVRFGWNSVAFMNTVHTSRPISFNYGNLGVNNDFGPVPPGAAAPTGRGSEIWERRTFHYFDGFNFGIALSF